MLDVCVAVNRSDHTHTDAFVLTATDSLSGICICADWIRRTAVCLCLSPKAGQSVSRGGTETMAAPALGLGPIHS